MPESSPLKKFIVLTVFGVAVALASLIASLPQPLPSNQGGLGSTTVLNDGDTAWLIVATVLGLFLSPALAYLYSILHGHDSVEAIKVALVVGSVITFLWVLFSFSMVYGKTAGQNGILGYPETFYMFKGTAYDSASFNNASTIPNSIFAVFELGFALLSATLVSASVAGRIELNGYLFFIFAWHLVVYAPVAHITWNKRGAFATNDIMDFSGALPVHSLASITALVLHVVLGKDSIPKPGAVADPERALFASLIVWFLWFGFNAGKAHAADAVAAQSIVNTIAATACSVFTAFFYNLIFEKAITSTTLVYAILIGLVGITPASGYVTVGGAMVISIFTYAFTVFVAQFVIGEGNEDNAPISVVTVHGVAGAVGFLWTAILSYRFVNNAGDNGLTYGRGDPLAYHIAFILALWGCASISVALLAFISNLIFPMGSGVIPPNEEERAQDNLPQPVPDQEKTLAVESSGIELNSV